MGKWKELAEPMTMKCDRCGEVNPAEIHTCTPKEQEPLWIRNREGKLELHAPPQRKWQGLTDEEIKKLHHVIDWTNAHTYVNFARAIEAKLKEKNT
jgi:hypothetical protein